MILKKTKIYFRQGFGVLIYTRLKIKPRLWCSFCKYWDNVNHMSTCGDYKIEDYDMRQMCINLPGLMSGDIKNLEHYIYVQQ